MANDLTLSIRLQADGSQLTGEVRSAKDRIASLGQASDKAAGGVEQVGRASQETNSQASRLNEESKRLAEGLNRIGEVAEMAKHALELFGVALGAREIIEGTRAIIEHATSLQRMALELGVTTSSLQELNHAALAAGMGVDQLTMGMRRQSQFVMSAVEGNKLAAEAMEKLHIDAKKLMELPVDVQTEKLARSILEVSNVTDQNRLALELWGRTGTRIIAIAREHGGSLDEVRAQAHELGLVLDQEDIETLHKLGVALDETAVQWKNMAAHALAAVTGPLQDAVSRLKNQAKDIIEATQLKPLDTKDQVTALQ